MKVGVIDLGSNSIRLVIYSWNGKKLVKEENYKRQAQSVKYVEDGMMNKIGVANIVSTLKELLTIAKANEVYEVRIFATASLRNIKNSEEVKAYIENTIHHKIDLLKGNEESLFGFEGMKQKLDLPANGVSVDVGGASSEITYFEEGKAIHTISIPIGSLNLYLSHVTDVLPNVNEIRSMRFEIDNYLQEIEWLSNLEVNKMIGIGGSARAIMRLHRAKNDIDSSIYDMSMEQTVINSYIEECMNRYDKLAKIIVNHIPERLTTLIPGTLILDEVMKKVNAKTYLLSPYGVREGYFYKKILKKGKNDQLNES